MPNGKPNASANSGGKGVRQAAEATTTTAGAAQRSGSAFNECAQEITAAWARYAEEVMRHTSKASRMSTRPLEAMKEASSEQTRS